MTNPVQLPVLFLSDVVVLPGMVVRVELDEPARAAIDAAQLAARESGDPAQVLVAPRLEDRYASYGVVASIEKVGRF
ncbi:LON peptidase substrate-binding domain-containing protein, partial [Nocardioides sp. GCM10030258]